MTPSIDVHSLARSEVRALPLYVPEVADCDVDLSDNTNLWGPPPAALRALQDAGASAVSRYPSVYSSMLRPAVFGYLGLPESAPLGIVTGCGSDNVIDSTLRAFGSAGDQVAFSAPTFSMIPIFARVNGLEPLSVPLTASFDVDAERLVSLGARITYLCSPNNPTATALSREAVDYVVTNARGIVLLDEAYAEFAPESFLDLVERHERLIVARTFSKAFGLAGLRVGYGVASTALAGLVERARGPYMVNALSERAVLASLREGDDGAGWVRKHAALAIELRTRLAASLESMGLSALPSAANFVFVPVSRARDIASALQSRGILVRAFAGLPRDLPELEASAGAALRIGVGPWPMMARLLDALGEVLT
ncbi:MAG: histidinol-phosphate aminotransferase family protein [Gemmatimonadaceae bacterium]|nr:histidinol-phosphate aminotransferase family protein [Gemmatimonadaceae bacterium]